jgi:hypothetical protein
LDGRGEIREGGPGSITERVTRLDVQEKDIPSTQEVQMDRWGFDFDNDTNKAFCACGAIAELDSSVISRKRNLGKEVECSRCRNRRISEEHRELRKLYSEEDDDWLYS